MGGFKYERNMKIGNIGFNAVTQEELINLIESVNVDECSAYVTFTGMQIIVKAEKFKEVADVENDATICAGDGMPVKWIGNIRGIKCDRCSGPDIMEKIIEQGIKKDRRHFFYGTTEKTLLLLKENLEKKYPGIKIVGTYSPPFRALTKDEDEEIINKINLAHPDYLWVGLGAPKQDIWMKEHQNKIKKCRMMGVGAAFNFLAGTVKRAPVIFQKSGFEWLYRLLQEPKHLWKRYLIEGPKFGVICIRDMLKNDNI